MKKAFIQIGFSTDAQVTFRARLFLLNIEKPDVDNKLVRTQNFVLCANDIQIKIRNLRRKMNTKITGTRCIFLQIPKC